MVSRFKFDMTGRLLQMIVRDPVFHIHLDRYVWEKMNELKVFVGNEVFHQLVSTIDPDISSQLQTFMRSYSNT